MVETEEDSYTPEPIIHKIGDIVRCVYPNAYKKYDVGWIVGRNDIYYQVEWFSEAGSKTRDNGGYAWSSLINLSRERRSQ